MPKIVGNATRVVEVDGLAIDEYVGNVGSQTDDISIAVVKISQPTSEPWLTLDYDEWMVVLKEHLEIHFHNDQNQLQVLTVKQGQTVFLPKGERFRPVFPKAGAEYIPVCIPAFRPDRCQREDEEGVNASAPAEKLQQLHASSATAPPATTTQNDNDNDNDNDKSPTTAKLVYHMCQKSLWEQAVVSQKAYFPPTFVQDGSFTHATAVPARLLETANHFYTATEGDWICLELSTSKLQEFGIVTLFEPPKPVGAQAAQSTWQSEQWACPHIYGGIPVQVPGLVLRTYDMVREPATGQFLSISGLTHHVEVDSHGGGPRMMA